MAGERVGGWRVLTPPERELVLERLRVGERPDVVAGAVGCSAETVRRIRRQAWSRRRVSRSRLRLCFEEREQISRGVAAGESFCSIGRGLGRAASTIAARSAAGRGAGVTGRWLRIGARSSAWRGRSRASFARCPELRAAVEAGLLRRWSPEQISARLKADHPGEPRAAGQSRDDLPVALHPVARRAAQPADREPAHQADQQKVAWPRPRGARADRGDGPDLRTPTPGRGPRRPRPLGRRPARRQTEPLVHRDARRAPNPLRAASEFGSDGTTDHVIEALERTDRDLPRHLLLSLTWDKAKNSPPTSASAQTPASTSTSATPLALATRHQRKHQRTAPPIPTQRHRPHRPHPNSARRDRRRTQRPPRQTLNWATPGERMEQLLR